MEVRGPAFGSRNCWLESRASLPYEWATDVKMPAAAISRFARTPSEDPDPGKVAEAVPCPDARATVPGSGSLRPSDQRSVSVQIEYTGR